jgi:peptidoglycan/LPS O-acetylase OafA/YrhL
MNTSSESSNLDFLRSVAVVYVVAFHLLLFFQHTQVGQLNLHSIGHFGVLLFFVHTSLVLMFSLERQEARGERSLFASFYARRCFRVLPLSILVVLAAAEYKLPVGYFRDGVFQVVHLTRSELLANLLLLQNLTHTQSIIAPLWSLPYEMQMYVLLPFVFLLVRRSQRWFVVAGIWLASAVVSLALQRAEHIADLVIYVPCFMAGIVAYQLTKSRSANLPFFLWPLVLASLTFYYLKNHNMISGWSCCLLVGLVLPQFREMKSRWCRKLFQGIARYSYGVYLSHVICMWFAFGKLAQLPAVARWLVFVLALVFLPIALYHLVESPMMSLGRRLLSRPALKERAIAQPA